MFTKYLIVFLISMVPLVELRGAVPYAIAAGLPVLPSYIIAIIGNMLPMPFIFFFARKVLEWGRISLLLVAFLPSVLKKDTRVARNSRRRLERDFIGRFSCLLESRFPEQAHGLELLQLQFLIWISKKA